METLMDYKFIEMKKILIFLLYLKWWYHIHKLKVF